jgi:hypothetical protein
VSVLFDCQDLDSGIASCTPAQKRVDTDGEHTVNGEAIDNVGNKASASRTVKLDQTRRSSPVGDVRPGRQRLVPRRRHRRVAVRGDRVRPGRRCPAEDTVTGEGDNLSATSTVVHDVAGNASVAGTVTGLKIDRTAPTARLAVPASTTQNDVTAVVTATDAHSGVAGVTINGPGRQRLGTEWSRSVALSCGANIVSAVVTDHVGHQTRTDEQTVVASAWASAPSSPRSPRRPAARAT